MSEVKNEISGRRKLLRNIVAEGALSAVSGLFLGQRLPESAAVSTNAVITDTGPCSSTKTNANGQVTFWDKVACSSISGSNNLFWDDMNSLSVCAVSGSTGRRMGRRILV